MGAEVIEKIGNRREFIADASLLVGAVFFGTSAVSTYGAERPSLVLLSIPEFSSGPDFVEKVLRTNKADILKNVAALIELNPDSLAHVSVTRAGGTKDLIISIRNPTASAPHQESACQVQITSRDWDKSHVIQFTLCIAPGVGTVPLDTPAYTYSIAYTTKLKGAGEPKQGRFGTAKTDFNGSAAPPMNKETEKAILEIVTLFRQIAPAIESAQMIKKATADAKTHP